MSKDALPPTPRINNSQADDAQSNATAECTAANELKAKHSENRQTAKTMRPLESNGDSSATLDRDQLSVAMLVEVYHRPLFRYAYRLTSSTADAEDLTQQTFMIAHQKLNQLRDCDKVQSWLFTVLRNAFLKQRKKQSNSLEVNVEQDIDKLCSEEPQSDAIDSEQLQNTLNLLPDEFKVVVMMFYFEQLPYKQIAEQLEIPMGTVMSRLSRAKTFLREKLIFDQS